MGESDGTTPTVTRESTSRTLQELNPPSPSTKRSRQPANNAGYADSGIVNAYDEHGEITWDDADLQENYETLPRQLGRVSGYGVDSLQGQIGVTEYEGMYGDPYAGDMYGNMYGDMYGNAYGNDMYAMNGYYGYGPGMYGYGYPGGMYGKGMASAITSHILCSNAWENLTVGFGASGFKSPLNFPNGGAFGFSETLNWASPSTSMMPVNLQAGVRAVQAFPSGYRDGYNSWHRGSREQYFGTIGVFRRNVMCSPVNVGLAYDLMNDKYFGDYDLEQVRAELSYGTMHGVEFGYRGAFGVRNDSFWVGNRYKVRVHVVDYHALFVKKYFANGGEGSLAGGATEYGDLMVRAEYAIPLSNEWGLKNSFSYVIPKGGHSPASPRKESWDVSLQLVFQPRGGMLAGFCNPFRSFFDVADNGTLIQRAK